MQENWNFSLNKSSEWKEYCQEFFQEKESLVDLQQELIDNVEDVTIEEIQKKNIKVVKNNKALGPGAFQLNIQTRPIRRYGDAVGNI